MTDYPTTAEQALVESCEDIIRRDDPDEDIDLARACLALVERVRAA